MRRLALLAAAVLLQACPACTQQNEPCAFTNPVTADRGFPLAGQPLAFAVTVARFCDPSVQVRASVVVTGPDGHEVALRSPASVENVTDRSSTAGMSMQVELVPQLPGSYHLIARFDPNLAMLQEDFMVVENRLDAGAAFTASLDQGLGNCAQVDVSPGGRLLCLDGAVSTYAADGALTQQLELGAIAARVDEVLWVVKLQDRVVSRWVETDAGFEKTASAVGTESNALQVFPSRDEAVLFAQYGQVTQVTWDGGTLAGRELGRLPGASGAKTGWREGDAFLLFVGTPGESVCDVPLGRLNDTVCNGLTRDQDFPSAIGTEPGGFWTQQHVTTLVGEVRLQIAVMRPGFSRTFFAPAPWFPPFTPSTRWPSSPYLTSSAARTQNVLLGWRTDAFVFQRFPDGTVVSVTPEWLAMKSGLSLLVYRR